MLRRSCWLLFPGMVPSRTRTIDRGDLLAIGLSYLVVVGLYRLAFVYFTVNSVVGLFLCFGGGMVIGVAGPIWYTIGIEDGRTPRSASDWTTGAKPSSSA